MKRSASVLAAIALFALASLPAARAEDSKDTQALLEALGKSKLTLLDGVRQATKGGAVPISAKFELEEGKPKIYVNLRVAKAQKVDFRAELLRLVKLV